MRARFRFPDIGYDAAALESYALFARLKGEEIIPPEVRFQVCLPTPFAILAGFVPEQGARVEEAMADAMDAAVQNICAQIPHDQLAIQWDIAYEVIGYDRGPPMYRSAESLLQHSVATVERHSQGIPESVEVGIHLCYGDPGHEHVVEPRDMGVLVEFANALSAGVSHPLRWIHMPVPRERNDRAYFMPLQDLEMGHTQLVLGLVHMTDGVPGTLERMRMADQFVSYYGIATECGFGRRPADSIPELLRIHVEAAKGTKAL